MHEITELRLNASFVARKRNLFRAFKGCRLVPAGAVALAALVFTCLAPALRAQSRIPSGKDVVAPSVYVSLDPAGRGSTARIAVIMKIRPGFHVNAREKSAEYLIATDLKAQVPAGLTAGEVSYPRGKLETFTFSKTPLNVYQDTVKLLLPVTVGPNAPLGPQRVPLKLRYQACSTEVCLPPVTLSLDATVNVAAGAAESKPAHPEVFGNRK
jgi:hypothetical protein